MSLRPRVTVYAQVSIDGKITAAPGVSSKGFGDLEGPGIQQFRHAQRARVDAIMVGSRTVWTDNPSLTVRFAAGGNPLRIIPASSGKLPAGASVLIDGNPTLVVVGEKAPRDHLQSLREHENVEVICCGDDRVNFAELLDRLGSRGVREMMVEGGGTLIAHMLACDLIDDLHIQHIPIVLGGAHVPTLVSGSGVGQINQGYPARFIDANEIDGHVVAHYSLRSSIQLRSDRMFT